VVLMRDDDDDDDDDDDEYATDVGVSALSRS
jgi:hypothetical protein